VVAGKPKTTLDRAKLALANMAGTTFTAFAVGDESQPTVALRSLAAIAQAKSGTALEGAVLAAAYLDAAGLSPQIVFTPDRVLVGWSPEPGESVEAYFLDATKLASFDDALQEGHAVYDHERDAHHFDMCAGAPAVTTTVDVEAQELLLRKAGAR
jgi:hypothetical protein